MIGDDNTCKDGSEVRPMGFVGWTQTIGKALLRESYESLTRVLRLSYYHLAVS